MALPNSSTDRAALVTGASSGIGEAIARELAARGHNVILVARRADALRALADELRSEHGVRAESVACDLTDPAARDRLAADVEGLGLEVSILVNNAGFGVYAPFCESDREREIAQVRINTEAVLHLTARQLPKIDRKSGVSGKSGDFGGRRFI